MLNYTTLRSYSFFLPEPIEINRWNKDKDPYVSELQTRWPQLARIQERTEEIPYTILLIQLKPICYQHKIFQFDSVM